METKINKFLSATVMTAAATLTLAYLFACVSPENWFDPKDSVPPGDVTIVRVENTNGGAMIIYTLPGDDDLEGAKVSYRLNEGGELLERYCSAHTVAYDDNTDTLVLEGFGDTSPRLVTVYAVDLSANVSPGVQVEIRPERPYIETVAETLNADATFSGIQCTWENEQRKDIALSLYYIDSLTGEWKLHDTFFSNNPDGKFAFRTFPSVEMNFRFEMRDRWENTAPAMEKTLTPLFEEQILSRVNGVEIWKHLDVEGMQCIYRGDVTNNVNDATMKNRVWSRMTDGAWPTNNSDTYWNPGGTMSIAHYIPDAVGPIPFPISFTIDLQKKSVYSRFKLHNRVRTPIFSGWVPVDFEVWGANEVRPLNPDDHIGDLRYWTPWAEVQGTDEWKNDWVKLANCKVRTVTGTGKYTAGMTLSEEDIDKYTNGYDFDFDEGVTQAFRYLRFVIYENCNDDPQLTLTELRIWGQYLE